MNLDENYDICFVCENETDGLGKYHENSPSQYCHTCEMGPFCKDCFAEHLEISKGECKND